ncbi:MAG: HD domain-containing protein [Promethearchaeota archaeon]
MPDDMPLPSKDIAFELLKILKVPYQVRRHSLKVSEKALELAEKITKNNINLELVEIGALLHDVGRSKTHGFKHGIIGGKILRERGFPKELARICETHILGGLDKYDTKNLGLPQKDYLPQTLEEKIICLADKLIAGTREVSIEQRFEKWFLKYGKTEILIKSKERIQSIQDEIASLI